MPEMNESLLKQELLEEDPEFRALFDDHQSAERRLAELAQESFVSEEAELEIKQIKRHKLYLKDRMEAILRAHREAGVSAGG